jgi:hypothetical protein
LNVADDTGAGFAANALFNALETNETADLASSGTSVSTTSGPVRS